jgi:hypothetical protein
MVFFELWWAVCALIFLYHEFTSLHILESKNHPTSFNVNPATHPIKEISDSHKAAGFNATHYLKPNSSNYTPSKSQLRHTLQVPAQQAAS